MYAYPFTAFYVLFDHLIHNRLVRHIKHNLYEKMWKMKALISIHGGISAIKADAKEKVYERL